MLIILIKTIQQIQLLESKKIGYKANHHTMDLSNIISSKNESKDLRNTPLFCDN